MGYDDTVRFVGMVCGDSADLFPIQYTHRTSWSLSTGRMHEQAFYSKRRSAVVGTYNRRHLSLLCCFPLECIFQCLDISEEQQEYLSKMHESIKKIHAILNKYRKSQSLRVEQYVGDSKMIVFDPDPKKPKM